LAEPLSKRHFILLPAVALPEDLQPLKVEALEAEALGDLPLADQIWWRIIAADPTDAQAREGARRVAAKLSDDDRNDSNYDDLPITPAEGSPLDGGEKAVASPPARWRETLSKRKFLFAGALGTAGVAVGGLVGFPMLDKPRRTPARSQQIMVTTVDSTGAATQNLSSNTIDIFSQPIDGQTSIEFSIIPGSDFWMGSPLTEPGRRGNEQQAHVKVGRVAIGRTTVTQRQWLAVLQEHSRPIQLALPNFPSSFKGDDLPVETVSWRYASEFCARLAAITSLPYRLPTEAEWEHACRAGTTTPFHFGPTLTPDVANYCGSGGAVCGWSYGKSVWSDEYGGEAYGDGAYAGGPGGAFLNATKAVRSYPSNAFGLFEMHGNVWEHCLDDWTERVDDLPTDGSPHRSGGSTQHPLRGGSWSHNPAICRSAYREWIDETSSGWEGRIGFRVACNL
jgi:formylglycine-generating enzyme required for sulfatase activity